MRHDRSIPGLSSAVACAGVLLLLLGACGGEEEVFDETIMGAQSDGCSPEVCGTIGGPGGNPVPHALLRGVLLKNRAHGLCLDGWGVRPYMFHCNPKNPYQIWTLTGYRQLKNKGTGKCLDGWGGHDGGLGDRPYQYTCSPSNPYQKWRVSRLLRNDGTGLCVDGWGGHDGALGDLPYQQRCMPLNGYQQWR